MTKIKNYVIGAHRRIKSTEWAWKDTKDEGDIYETYKEMYRLSRNSLYHFLEGEWEELCWQEEIDSIQYAMKMNWQNVYNLWHSEPCNILALGPDVQMVKPTKIFGEFDNFRMFNWTDPKEYREPNPWQVALPNFFNGDMKYYPHTMSEELWDLGLNLAQSWTEENTTQAWSYEQVIENIMFWSQGFKMEEVHRPDLFYQAHMMPWISVEEHDKWNNFPYSEAHIVHWHSSRHSPTKLECMRYVNEALSIPLTKCKLDKD